jgi:soluble lytic murein transglycosylase-like protein
MTLRPTGLALLLALCLCAGYSVQINHLGEAPPPDPGGRMPRPEPLPQPEAAPAAPVRPKAPAVTSSPRYHHIVEQAARRYRVSASLIHAVIQTESAYRADAVSSKGAVGLMQLMPATAQRYGVTDLHDPVQNIHVGTRHLRELLKFFDEDIALAVAAYNAGAGAVMRYGGIPPYRETTEYVVKVLDRYQRHGSARRTTTAEAEYGIALPRNQ